METYVGLGVLWRQAGDEPWRLLTLREGDVPKLPEVGIEIPVDTLYARVNFSIPDDTDAET